MIFYIDFFGNFNWKMSDIGGWLTFPYKGFPNKDIMDIPHNICSGAILFSITSFIYYFRVQTTIHL